MPTPKECRYNAEMCLKLADETREIYAKKALIELAEEFRALATHLEHRSERYRSTTTLHGKAGGRATGNVDDVGW
jgi:hypothetical protein